MDSLLSKYFTKSIRISPDGFSFFKTDDNGKIERADYAKGENALIAKLAPDFFKFAETGMKPLDIIVATNVPMLIPDTIYDDAKAKEYLQLQYDITFFGQHYSDQIDQYRALYFLTQNEHSTLNDLYCVPHFISETSLLTRFIKEQTSDDALLLTINNNFVDLLSVQHNAITFVNRFTHIENIDVLYQVLHCRQQLKAENAALYVYYFADNNKKLNDLLQEYHKNTIIL